MNKLTSRIIVVIVFTSLLFTFTPSSVVVGEDNETKPLELIANHCVDVKPITNITYNKSTPNIIYSKQPENKTIDNYIIMAYDDFEDDMGAPPDDPIWDYYSINTPAYVEGESTPGGAGAPPGSVSMHFDERPGGQAYSYWGSSQIGIALFA